VSGPAWNSNLQPDFNVRVIERFRRKAFCRASRTRREQSIRPKISRIDVDLIELESCEVWWGAPEPAVGIHAGLGARADLAAPPDLSAHVAALADACAEVVDLDTKETFQRGKGAQLCVFATQTFAMAAAFARALLKQRRSDCIQGHWALCAKALLRALGRSVFAEGPLGDFALQTLCLVGVCDDGNDSPNRFFDPFDAPGLVAMLKRRDAASEDLALDIKQRLGFSDEALVDVEADGDAIELRDVACLLIAHQVHEWDEASDGYKRRPHTTEWLRQLKGSVDVLLDLVKSQRRATHHAARELLGTMGGEDDLVAAVTEVVCADALEVVRKEAPHLGPGVTTHGAGQHKRATCPTSKAPISAVFHSFRLIFGRAIISRNGLEA
jgi:hypothetical protein